MVCPAWKLGHECRDGAGRQGLLDGARQGQQVRTSPGLRWPAAGQQSWCWAGAAGRAEHHRGRVGWAGSDRAGERKRPGLCRRARPSSGSGGAPRRDRPWLRPPGGLEPLQGRLMEDGPWPCWARAWGRAENSQSLAISPSLSQVCAERGCLRHRDELGQKMSCTASSFSIFLSNRIVLFQIWNARRMVTTPAENVLQPLVIQ